ncbi:MULTISPECIES: TolC family protein [unclassified Achromobacter]|uniref:TolC family protein n=1 Tax=unclassified Achromobacter TaxID=2626865 RepID=UPI000B514E79|nr:MULTISPECIES: TolC family protein [unclassified Achromobacter]OWT74796.1 RND transporter [Achromobacter sp. HZ34]OWT79263.1 RND transporter [Achromobacter sp. HZ28]
MISNPFRSPFPPDAAARNSAASWRPLLRLIPLLFLLTGCAVGPDFEKPAPAAPSDWTAWRSGDPALTAGLAVGSAPLPADWWTQFQDPVLDRLQQRAVAASPDLRSAALRFAQSRTQRDTVAAQRGPAVNANGAIQRQRSSEYSAGTRLLDLVAPEQRDELARELSSPFTDYQAGFDASWEVDLWGHVARSVEAADADTSAAAAMLQDMRLTVASEVSRAYFELRLAQRQRAIIERDIGVASDTLDLIRARARGGLIDDFDVTRQRTQLADLQSRLPGLQAQEASAINQIGVLTGARPGELTAMLAKASAGDAAAATRPPTGPGQRPRAGTGLDPDAVGAVEAGTYAALPDLSLGLPSQVALHRPDIRAAEYRLHAATANIGVATADLYPRITLGASFGYDSYQGHRFGEWGTRNWQIGPTLSLPIFDMGRRRSVVVLRELQQQEAAVNYQRTILKAWQEIDDALTAYGAERQRNARLREKAASSADAYALARARYTRGMTDLLAQLDAERGDLQARSDLADSDSRLRMDLVAIYKAVGGGALDQPSPTAPVAPAPCRNCDPSASP